MTGLLFLILVAASVPASVRVFTRPQARRPQQFDQSAVHRPVIESIGRVLRRGIGRESDVVLDRQLGWAVVVSLPIGLVRVELGAVLFLAIRALSVLRRRRLAQLRADRIGAALADVIDLLAVSLLSGNTVAGAVRQIVAWSLDNVGDGAGGEDDFAIAFAWCERQVAEGRPLSDALELLPARLGSPVQPLVSALVATERYGAPIAHSLTQLAADSRADQRRRAEAAARRLPVSLLFPLVVCVLPAFLLLTVVPVLAEALRSFDFAASP